MDPATESRLTILSCHLDFRSKLNASAVPVIFHSWRYFKPEEGGLKSGERKRSRDRLYTLGYNSLDRSPVVYLWWTKCRRGGKLSRSPNQDLPRLLTPKAEFNSTYGKTYQSKLLGLCKNSGFKG